MSGAALRKALMLVGREFHGLHVSAPNAFQPFTECEHPICKEASNALAATEETPLVGPREMTANEMLRHVVASLRGYPNHGGDIEVMVEVDRIVTEALAARREPGPSAEHRKLTAQLEEIQRQYLATMTVLGFRSD